jgi:hypothetical protein
MPLNENSAYSSRFNMVMLPDERAMLQALARSAGLKESDIIRQMIRRDYVGRFGAKKPGKPTLKRNSRATLKASRQTRSIRKGSHV